MKFDMTDFDVPKFSKPCFALALGVAVTGAVFGAEPMKKLSSESEIKAVIQPVGQPVPVVIPRPEPPATSNRPNQSPATGRLSK